MSRFEKPTYKRENMSDLEQNKRTVTGFYDLMFNQDKPRWHLYLQRPVPGSSRRLHRSNEVEAEEPVAAHGRIT